jgi:hypothetical protein
MQYLVANLLEISIRGMFQISQCSLTLDIKPRHKIIACVNYRQQNMHSRLFQRMLATTLVKSTSVFTPFLSMGNISRVCLVNLD